MTLNVEHLLLTPKVEVDEKTYLVVAAPTARVAEPTLNSIDERNMRISFFCGYTALETRVDFLASIPVCKRVLLTLKKGGHHRPSRFCWLLSFHSSSYIYIISSHFLLYILLQHYNIIIIIFFFFSILCLYNNLAHNTTNSHIISIEHLHTYNSVNKTK